MNLMRHPRAGYQLLVLVFTMALLASACSSGDDSSDESTVDTTPSVAVEVDTVTVNDSAVSRGDDIDLKPGDSIAVTDDGVGTVIYPGLLELELLKSGSIVTPDPSSDPLAFDLAFGHLRVKLDRGASVPVVLNLGVRTLTTLDPGTEFIVCQGPDGTTCVFVLEGRVQWDGDGEPTVYTTGQSTFARPGEPPILPNCPPRPAFSTWLEESRTADDDRALAQFVSDFAASGCETSPTTTAPTDTPDITAPPVEVVDGLPSGFGMISVNVANPIIGTEDFADKPAFYREPLALEGPIQFFIDEAPVSNRDFRVWLVLVAGDDASEWTARAPDPWLRNAPGGAATQATYPEGEGDEPVLGVQWQVGADYCSQQRKRLATEIEWELAATNGFLTGLDQGRQDWVSESDAYGPGLQSGQRMLRGTDSAVFPDVFYRLAVPEAQSASVARANAGLRCATTEVEAGTQNDVNASGEIIEVDEFCDTSQDWPQFETEEILIGYHPPCVYHVEGHVPHVQIVMARESSVSLDAGTTVDTSAFVARTEGGPGKFRYGLMLGSVSNGHMAFTVQAASDTNSYDWCLEPMGDAIEAALAETENEFASALPPTESERHSGENCARGVASGSVEVQDLQEPLRLTIQTNTNGTSVSIDGEEVGSVPDALTVEQFGFFVENFHLDLVHIHYENITVTTP
jgi:hypothetical protein